MFTNTNHLSSSETLAEAVELIGYQPVNSKPDRAGWVTFWCPFHDDIARKGHSGKPNFRFCVETGAFTCFVCGRKGGSLYALARELGETTGRVFRILINKSIMLVLHTRVMSMR